MNHSRVAFLGLVLGLCAVGTTSSVVRAQAAAPSHIAVVDLRKVYGTIQETVDTQTELKGMQGELDTMQKSHQAQLTDFQQKITNSVKQDSQGHADMMSQFDEMGVQFAGDEKKMQAKMVRKQQKQLKSAYDHIAATVADLAKKKGLDLVLVNTSTDLPASAADIGNVETLAGLIFNRTVLYASDKADMTAEVITALDADYKNHPAK